ncbi:MAG: hypothetical protein S4CHLAM45_07760 [Chlamydiales bacterium]|nr:hypothetical protein [Chlamydiales bacterium]MCH9622882.1 hypothetical protein [Chlamydiales bacterium]
MIVRLLFCIFVFGFCLYAYVDRQNQITKLRLQIPRQLADLERVEQENMSLQFEIDRFESPTHLLEIAQKPEYRHLKHPAQDEVIVLKKES